MSASPGTQVGIERLARFFADAATRQGVLARSALGSAAPDDDVLTRSLILGMQAEASNNHGNYSAVVPAIWRIHELIDLGWGPHEDGFQPVLTWLLELQEKPGTFSQGCNRTRHSHRVCEHFLSGFFSPAPPEHRLAPIMFPNGKVFRAEPAARFAVSCLALRAALRGGADRIEGVQRHVAGLMQLQEQWGDWNGYFAGDAIVAGAHALASSPATGNRLRSGLAAVIAAHQGEDGTWVNADFFHTLEALLALGNEEAHLAVSRAVPALLERQRPDGCFGSTARQERALIALRALLWAEQEH